jgi:lipoyl(octanoyl) transferase
MKRVEFRDLGLIEYAEAWALQEQLFNQVVSGKLYNRDASPEEQLAPQHYLLFCEHPHVYTLGRSGHEKHLLVDDAGLRQLGASYFKNNRGGDITYHGPGQLVGYPILDLDHFFTDIHKYMRFLEEAVIRTLAEYGITGDRYPGFTGVWLDPDDKVKARKICAMGVRCSRWVTMHGFAFNVHSDLSYFNNIVPCGITDKSVTSIEKELGFRPDMQAVKDKLRAHLADIFGMELVVG